MTDDTAEAPATQGFLLGGRVRYAQPKDGYRTGIEPVFLAASVPARPGERVLEAGTGAGAGLLCLAHRVGGLHGTGLEIEPAMARLAAENFAANACRDLTVVCADVAASPLPRLLGAEPFDHILSNPPWHDASGTHPADMLRERAKMAEDGLLDRWIGRLAPRLKPRGSMTLILPARAVPEAMTALGAGGCGSLVLFPLWPRAGREAKMLLIQAIKGGRAECRMLPGLTLHDGPAFTLAAHAVLREGAAIDLRRSAA
ncbi:tRNA1(Val) (adenine(37)-N6)-methyltransferase [Acidisoma silvae]|uniref:Methyltransferase domain-containing protein n=1 Tax=Acidisoma silvae TaxID=2802396 RepID=A0A963YTE9_9PROT|nr:methyltransferase domain-containing protein [Acidisoma silvae]MCB8876207.1 methyltransferase domain-containing protein [Acidisoma silvae]